MGIFIGLCDPRQQAAGSAGYLGRRANWVIFCGLLVLIAGCGGWEGQTPPSAGPVASEHASLNVPSSEATSRDASEAVAFSTGRSERSPARSSTDAPADKVSGASPTDIRRLVATEELILQLGPLLKGMDRGVANLKLPDDHSQQLFAAKVLVRDLAADLEPGAKLWQDDVKSWSVQRRQLPLAPSSTLCDRGALSVWPNLWRNVDYVDHGHFAIVSGRFLGDEPWRQFETIIAFRGRAYLRAALWADVQAIVTAEWNKELVGGKSRSKPESADSSGSWRITRWRTDGLQITTTRYPYFTDVLDQAIPSASARQAARHSRHWLYATRHYFPQRRARVDAQLKDARFFPISTAYHPGVSIVDLNDDGWDDFYVSVRWGHNLLFVNQGDGTFREEAAKWGLDVPGRTNATIFADFDNDGDKDAMLARGSERSLYLRNEQGRFVDRSSDIVGVLLPHAATSVTAADVNQDGLLDVYFCTYHQDDVSRQSDADFGNPQHRIHRHLTPQLSVELIARHGRENRSFINQVGPPNVLLINRGHGQFAESPHASTARVWRNSFQASWSDFDADGDVDVYVANDFARDMLLRNDGTGRFEDVTEAVGLGQLGFGMGVAWGDYDNDGRFDLYVSNMFSKAGRRITATVAGLDQRISLLATGNYLYQGRPSGRFQWKSAPDMPHEVVSLGGWSWGGQFADLNNDTWQDIYVGSGYFTAPKQFGTTVDL